MPDVSIADLPVASTMSDAALAVVYQDNETRSITGAKIKSYAETAATDIAEPVAAAAVEDKFDDMDVLANTLSPGSQATAVYDAENNTLTLGIPRGQDGGGAGDMTKATYDPTNAVANAGGIPAFVGDKIDDPAQKSAGQVLTYNGSAWEASSPSGGMTGQTFTVTLPTTGWTYSSEVNTYSITVPVTGLKTTYPMNPVVDLAAFAFDKTTEEEILASWSQIYWFSTATNALYAWAFQPPTTSVRVNINVWE